MNRSMLTVSVAGAALFVGLCALPNQGTPSAVAGSQVNTTDTEGGGGASGGGTDSPGAANSVPHAKGVPTPNQVLAAVRASGVKLVVEPGWNLEWDLPSRRADWRPIGVMLHHTGTAVPGNAPSRQFLLDYRSPASLPSYDGLTGGRRGCHFLIGRDGTVYFMRATRGPHAGQGPGMKVGGDTVTADNGNGRFYGIEIESAGHSSTIHQGSNFIDGFGVDQVDATAKVTAALLRIVNRGPDHVIDHKAWAPGRKVDLNGTMVADFRNRTARLLTPPAVTDLRVVAGPKPGELRAVWRAAPRVAGVKNLYIGRLSAPNSITRWSGWLPIDGTSVGLVSMKPGNVYRIQLQTVNAFGKSKIVTLSYRYQG